MPRNVPPRPVQSEFAEYSRSLGIVTRLLPAGWIAGEKERMTDPSFIASCTPCQSEGQALIAHWDAWATEMLAELEAMSDGYCEALQALEAAGLAVDEEPGQPDTPHRYRYQWDGGDWSDWFVSEGAAITHAIATIRKGGAA